MTLSFKVDVRQPQHLCKLHLSDVHLANAKNREFSSIKYAVACSLSKIC
ncbi:hypothetical protein [uncultured Campylobacter sp.]|nr:hypothetical protein [uncultured Campylobacter sp.]